MSDDTVTAGHVIQTPSAGPSERNPPWVADELILALDLYMTNRVSPPGKTSGAVAELSAILNRLGEGLGRPHGADFRNPNGVYMKMMNFRRFDPDVQAAGKVGLSRGNKLEEVIWNEFAGDRAKLAAVAAGIRAAVETGALGQFDYDDDTIEEALEGRVFTRLHFARERDRELVKAKKHTARKQAGCLKCETCGFDFEIAYGERGLGFIECHHVRPVHTLAMEGEAVTADDLALVCANCHRMIHSTRPWLSVAEMQVLVARARSTRGIS